MSAQRKVFFVTGTDTGVGKSLVSASLLQAALQRGLTTAAVKPVASGCSETAEGLRNDDALLLQQYCSPPLAYQQINPVALAPAIAPHLAADQAGVRLDVDRLAGFCRAVMMQRVALTVIEGAGGWRVPLNMRQTLADLPRLLEIPVLLVVGVRLGCINHAVLSADAIRADGLELAGWIANQVEPEMPAAEENIATIASMISAPCVARIPWQQTPDVTASALAFADFLDNLFPATAAPD
jgi:dethiobiotin synthetase